MGWVHPTPWATHSIRECLQSIKSEKGLPKDLAISFFLLLYMVPGIWRALGRILSTRYLRINPRIRWYVRTPFYYVIVTSRVSFCQLSIYWILRGQLFLSFITWPKIFLKFLTFSEKVGSDLPKEPIQNSISVKCVTINYVCDKRSIL